MRYVVGVMPAWGWALMSMPKEGLDAHRPKLVKHHPRRHEVGVVAGKGADDGRVLDHRALGCQHPRNGAFAAFRPHSRRRAKDAGKNEGGADDGRALKEFTTKHASKSESCSRTRGLGGHEPQARVDLAFFVLHSPNGAYTGAKPKDAGVPKMHSPKCRSSRSTGRERWPQAQSG